jgi:predicted RNase H-like HicB family nuclease
MQTSDQIEQLLRASFPFASHWHFRCTKGCVYYLMGEGEDSIALHRYQHPESWGTKLEDGGCWILSASEGSTPAEAISNLQVAISQVRVIAGTTEDAMADASQALAAVREFQSDREFWIKPMGDANLE